MERDFFMTPVEAKNFGLLDHVVEFRKKSKGGES
jgi:ATP-dependent protease ClpP protease subunit